MSKIIISQGCSQAQVELTDAPVNPYRDLLGREIWKDLKPIERFDRVKALLQKGDEVLDRLSFKFDIKGLPRHQFAQHARARVGVSFEYRDPEQKPTHFMPYTPVYQKMFLGSKAGSEVGGFFEPPSKSVSIETKDDGSLSVEPLDGVFTMLTDFGKRVAEQFLDIPEGGWTTIRDYLPLCYEQPYSFRITFRTLIGQCSRRLCLGEEAQIVTCHYLQKASVAQRFPMLASVLNPTCIRVGKCLYAKSYTLSNAFGCLFAGCNYRFPKGTDYASFNESCSDIRTLRDEVAPKGIIDQMDSLKLPENYKSLSSQDLELFYQE